MIGKVFKGLYVLLDLALVVKALRDTKQEVNVIKEGILKRIHVNQHHIRANLKDDGNRPVFTIKTSKDNIKTDRVEINGPSTLLYSPDKPLSCGAKCWIETKSEIVYE